MNFDPKRKTADLLTICIKSGNAVFGFDMVSDAVRSKNAFCVMAASDTSGRTMKEISFICGKYGIPLIVSGFSKEDFSRFTRKTTALIAVCDKGFADRFIELNKSIDEDDKVKNTLT